MTQYEKLSDERDAAMQEMFLAFPGSTHELYLRLRAERLTDRLLNMTREEAEREVEE